jgi:hypothetical protein
VVVCVAFAIEARRIAMNPPFNVKKHSDITVTVIGEPGDER